jgi:hypothetical protein
MIQELRNYITPMAIGSLITSVIVFGALVMLLIDIKKELKEYENRESK